MVSQRTRLEWRVVVLLLTCLSGLRVAIAGWRIFARSGMVVMVLERAVSLLQKVWASMSALWMAWSGYRVAEGLSELLPDGLLQADLG